MRIGITRYYPMKSPQGRVVSLLMLAAGLLMCLFGSHMAHQYNRIQDELVQVEAVVDRIEVTGRGKDTDYDTYVSYTLNGREYRNVHLSWGSSNTKRGQTLTLEIHPDDPTKPVSDIGTGFAVSGILFAMIGAAFAVYAWEDQIKKWSASRKQIRTG